MMRDELHDMIFEADVGLLPLGIKERKTANEHAITQVVDRWPLPFQSKQSSYEHFVNALNATRPSDNTSQLLCSRGFFVYSTEMHDRVEGGVPLKPDILLTHGVCKVVEGRARWRDVMIAVGVECSWQDLMARAATYAAAMFDAHKSRRFAPVIGFNNETCDFRFIIFHRGGAVASTALNLRTPEGVRSITCILEAVFSWETEVDAGFGPSSGIHPFNSAELISVRACVRGRANCVAVITSASESPQGDQPSSKQQVVVLPSKLVGRPSKTTTSQEDLEDITALYSEKNIVTPGNSDTSQPPGVLVMKQSWIVPGIGSEATMLHKVSGHFGLPTLW